MDSDSTHRSMSRLLKKVDAQAKAPRPAKAAKPAPAPDPEPAADLLDPAQGIEGEVIPAPRPKRGRPRKNAPASNLRKAPGEPEPHDDLFYLPAYYDIPSKDIRITMDVALYRLSKRGVRKNDKIRYELVGGYIEVTSGAAGMATVYDYDLVMMAVSNLTEAINRYRKGEGTKPSKTFRPHISEVLKFCRRANGGTQKKTIVEALERLATTHVKIERLETIKGKKKVVNEGDNLIGPYKTISSATTGKVEYIEFKIPDWIYNEIMTTDHPDVLTMHPDYFLIDGGIVRHLYRLARRAAGKGRAEYSFQLIHERSGSASTIYEVNRMLREAIAANDMPEYHLEEQEGRDGPKLVMTHRSLLTGMLEADDPGSTIENDEPDET